MFTSHEMHGRRTPIRVLMIVLASLLAAAASVVIVPVSASADAPITHERYTFDFDFIDDQFCGDMNMRVEGEGHGTVTVKEKGGQLIYFMEDTHLRRTYTNLDTGKTATDVSNRLSKDQRVTINSDGTLTIHAAFIGHESIVGANGGRPTTTAGKTDFIIVIDYAGTLSDPSDDVLISEEVVRNSGTGFDGDFCEILREATSN